MKKICIVTTMWSSINNWIKPFLNEYDKHGIDVTIVCNMDEEYRTNLHSEYPFVHSYAIDFPRGIDVFGSLKSVINLYIFFKKNKFDLVQYSTPNASLYTAVASWLANIPVRLYCQWGMVYVTMNGMKRRIFKTIERIVCKCSTCVQPDSFGNLEFCRKEGFYDASKSCVIWNGSAKGLDLSAYDPSMKTKYSQEIKEKYGIKKDEIVLGFVGRLGKEKGCNELFEAFRRLKKDYPNMKLLFVGPIEKENTISPELLDYFWSCEDIIKTDRVSNVEKYISAMDVFALPSYREGFGMSVIEASAMCVPVVVTEYPGPSGGMIDGVTGISVSVGSVSELESAIRNLIESPTLATDMGEKGRKFVVENFDQNVFIDKYIENRMCLLANDREIW